MPGTKEKVYQHIAEKLGIDEWRLTAETSFADDLGVDSLDVLELITTIEKDFGIVIPDEDAEKIKTVGALENYVIGSINPSVQLKTYPYEH